MAKIGDYAISEYQGGVSSMDSSYGEFFTGYHLSAGELGGHTNPGTANQIQEINKVLNQGTIPIEIMSLDPAVFEAIPKQHFKEINRMQKLTGSKISLHAPLVEPSGISREGGPWQESERERVEHQLKDVMSKALDLDDERRVPVTIHTTGNNMLPGKFFEWDEKQGKKVLKKSVAIDKASGQLMPLTEDAHYYPGKENLQKYSSDGGMPLKNFGSVMDPEKRLKIANETQWDNEVNKIIFQKNTGDQILNELPEAAKQIYATYSNNNSTFNDMDPSQQKVVQKMQRAHAYIRDANQAVTGLFSKAFENDPAIREDLKKLSKDYAKNMGIDIGEKELSAMSLEERNEFILNQGSPSKESNAIQILTEDLRNIHPQMIVHIDDFAREKSSETFANVAFDVWGKAKKAGKKSPILSIENMFPGTVFSDSDEMNKLIEETRRRFVEKAVSSGVKEKDAKKEAEQAIGMTLDVGHLNLGRAQGMKEEDLVREAKAMAKNVRHVHLTDNFGFGDSHLTPGMGNVPFKEILMELEKAGTLKNSRKIIEAGGIIQHFQTSPMTYALEGMGSPMYAEGVGPYWSQTVGLTQGYSSGMGKIFPNVNYQTFGGGFSQLPAELGGSADGGGQGNRMSGRGME